MNATITLLALKYSKHGITLVHYHKLNSHNAVSFKKKTYCKTKTMNYYPNPPSNGYYSGNRICSLDLFPS